MSVEEIRLIKLFRSIIIMLHVMIMKGKSLDKGHKPSGSTSVVLDIVIIYYSIMGALY